MKPIFFRRKFFWLSILVLGLIFVGIGIFQMSLDIGSRGVEGEPLSPVNIESKNKKVTDSAQNETRSNSKRGSTLGEARPNEFFVEYRLERDRARSQQVDLLREIVNNQNSSNDAKKEAQNRLLAISKAIDTEMKLENLIMAENFKDAVVFVEDKSVTVIVQIPMLTALDREKITGITSRVTGLNKESVIVIPKA